jgi:hypothetical protein
MRSATVVVETMTITRSQAVMRRSGSEEK